MLTDANAAASFAGVDAPFHEHRTQLFGVAYRMLGSVAEAEDMVQETYLRWRRQLHERVETPRAWLLATVTRLCIDQLRSGRRLREEYYGVWLPEPLVQEMPAVDPGATRRLADSLSVAFMLMLEALTPRDRAVFLLREVFDHDYDEIARMVGVGEAACRQIVSRARRSLRRGAREDTEPDELAETVARRFVGACRTGDVAELLSVLAEDVTLFSDGGGRVRAALRPIRTADRVSRFFIGIRRKGMQAAEYRTVRVNASPGILVVLDGRIDCVLSFEYAQSRIRKIFLVRNPDKLRHLV
ncbi:RNA polymerase sigma-70 factor [Opitutales bacterium ASA1]|uniref:RNA polymerase sigma-70 factor n=1 Tax=Congregicoccus parvus TaxID=3081749 RepID=UPI002B2915F7|nr:RNA polymerase sigma-70 factor [Opitutales bacterium ASA1]